jgi:hypothetical protein
MSFKKRETNQNKIRHPGRKRKIIATIALSLSLLFGKTRLSSSQSSSPNFDNKVVQERIIDDQEFCSLEDNDQQVILVKTGDSAPSVPTSTGRGQPSNFPTPPAGGRPSRPVYVPKYRIAPKVVPGANPAGAGGVGGAAEFDDQCPAPKKKQQSQKSYKNKVQSDAYNSKKKKKPEAEQCKLEDEFKKDKKYGGFEYKLDKNGNPILRVETKTGSEVLVTYEQSLEKYYHEDVYNLKKPKGYDAEHAKSLNRKDRIEYLKKTVPREYVIEYQLANAKSLSTENFLKVPGFISAQKESGTLYINKETRQVHFVNDRTNIWRTTVIKSRTGLLKLAKNGFHLFPNAGKK